MSTFGSRFGTIAVVGGSVVGLGNIWRFPYIAGEGGGAAFILIYIAITLIISIPLMLSEFTLGRETRSNSMRAFRIFRPKSGVFWKNYGFLGICTALVILSFYNVIAGWSVKYLYEAVKGSFLNVTEVGLESQFTGFISSGFEPMIFTLIIMSFCCLVVSFGVNKGIERYNKLLMPVMFVILLGMVANSVTMSGFDDAVKFLFTPDFSKVNMSVVLNALGQSFFSMSIGLGAMITYGAYVDKKENLYKIASYVAVSDLTIAILSGLAIFPAVFTAQLSPSEGPSLVFLTLPYIFSEMPMGYFVSIIFFLLLILAAITSIISLIEVLTKYICDEFNVKRGKSTIIVFCIMTFMSLLCVLSQMEDSSIRLFGYNIFDLFDKLSSNFMMPIGGILTAIFVGWLANKEKVRKEMTTNYTHGLKLFNFVYISIKFVIPIIISILFLNLIGLF